MLGYILPIKIVLGILLGVISLSIYGERGLIIMSSDASNLASWIIASSDNQKLPFIIIDKKEAKIFVFEPNGILSGQASALIGATVGDDNVPGIGGKKLSDIRIDERITPAGRFEASLGQNLNKSELLWIDYDSAISLHSVVTSNPLERRLQRLSSKNANDHRITYGCINISSDFYKEIVHPVFINTNGIVYILPEVHSILTVFGAEASHFGQN